MTPSRDSSYKPGSAKIRRRQTRPARIGRLSSHLIRLALHHRNVVQSILLVRPFGKGFDERNLRHMRDFYQSFPIWNAVRHIFGVPRNAQCRRFAGDRPGASLEARQPRLTTGELKANS
ncbi:hypothetical protein CRX69_24970 [Pseudomonas rhizophila]|uniref:Uncharacterized protein n=1 Tax=Pseudomonas rhizophila TaxID=2045200 RepID=A0ABN5JZF5_9PSED|nr:hypothetical protein CRX69_24970 [Pseudomonas rhizophila]